MTLKRRITVLFIAGLVIAAVGIGAWAHLRQAKATDPELQQPSESKS